MSAPFEIAAERDGGTLRLVVAGELDIASASELASRIEAEAPAALVLDLSGVTFIDSTGLRAVLGVHEQLGDGLRIVASEPAMRLFKLVGADARLPLE